MEGQYTLSHVQLRRTLFCFYYLVASRFTGLARCQPTGLDPRTQFRSSSRLYCHSPTLHDDHKANQQNSNLREIPDHQELFLSPETLSNLIIEINQRVSQADALSTFTTLSHQHPTLAAGSGSASSATQETVDQAAALHHLHDLCDEGDTMEVITPPHRVTLPRLGTSPQGSSINAYRGVASFTTRTNARGERLREPVGTTESVADAAVGGATMNGETGLISKTTCHYLLVRLEAQETDLLVLFNVPHGEFDKNGDARGLSREEAVAEETVAALVQSLEVRDWGLFV
jgi:Ran-interacting Mog1 protein